MKKIYVILILFSMLPFPARAEDLPAVQAPVTVQDKKIALYQAGLAALQQGDLPKAMSITEYLRQLDPKDEGSYRLSVMAHWQRRDFYSLVAAVQVAKQNGVESIFLYQYLTQALFFLGDFGTSLQGFKKIETLLEKQKQRPAV